MAKKTRSPARAVQVIERAAKMSKFKPGLFDRDFAGDRMRSPGLGKVSFDYNTIDPARVRATGIKDVPLRNLVTDQPTVSIKTLKDKLLNPNARNSSALPKALLDPNTGKYVIPDGVHRRAVAAALGQKSMRVATGEITRQPLARPRAAPSDARMSAMTKAGAAAAVAGPAVAAVNGFNRSVASGSTTAEAVVQGMRDASTMAAVGAVSAGAFVGLAAAAKMIAPRIAPALGPIGWAATAGMMGYGAVRGYRSTGTLSGSLKGAVGLDVKSSDPTTAALMAMSEPLRFGMGAEDDISERRSTYRGPRDPESARRATEDLKAHSKKVMSGRHESMPRSNAPDRESKNLEDRRVESMAWSAERAKPKPPSLLDRLDRTIDRWMHGAQEPQRAVGAPMRMTADEARRFEKADAARPRADAAPTQDGGNKLRGFQNPANMQAALAAQGKAWSGDYDDQGGM